MDKILTDDLIKKRDEIVEKLVLDEARKKELELIYPSLVGIAEGQLEITITVPNGIWKFEHA